MAHERLEGYPESMIKHALALAAALAVGGVLAGGRQARSAQPWEEPDNTLQVVGWVAAAGCPGALFLGGLAWRDVRRERLERERVRG